MDHQEGKKPSSGQQSLSPSPSNVSLRSDQSMHHLLEIKASSSGQQSRLSPSPSNVSLSDESMHHLLELKAQSSGQQSRPSPSPSHVSLRSDQSMHHLLEVKASSSGQQIGSSPSPSCVSLSSDQSMRHLLDLKTSSTASSQIQEAVQSNLRSRCQYLSEALPKQSVLLLPLNEIYTELFITESENGEINYEHEVRSIERMHWRTLTEENPINLNDIFKPLPRQDRPIRTVLTKGVAGIGKTMSVQKFILDWAEGEANQDVHLMFPLPFRELNLLKDRTFSLKNLLQFFMEINLEIFPDEGKIIFIFDGLDECRLPLDFQNNVKLCDVTESASVDVLLTNLIMGNLLPSALIWITSRPAAADLIPSECVNRVTEVRGFNDPQKEEYIRKRIRDQTLSDKITSHLKSSRSLYFMCHIPVFCWISATVLEKMLSEAEITEIPKTLTQMYTHFLILQIRIKNEKAYDKNSRDIDIVLKLGKLAFQQLGKRNLIFYKEDLIECGIDEQEASVFSGLCTQIFREESGMFQGKVYSFVHLSVQEHLAALYVYLSFVNENINKLSSPSVLPRIPLFAPQGSIYDLHQKAVKKALQSTSGHLDLFLRFLLGFSLESNQTLLQDLLMPTEGSSDSREQIVRFIKEKIKENPSPEKMINLFHCLNELGDHSLVEEIQDYTESRINMKLTGSQWSALVFVLLTSGQKLDVFDLKKYTGTHISPDEGLQRLQPVLAASQTAKVNEHNLTKRGFKTLAAVLTSKTSCLRELSLSKSIASDSGLKLLCSGLENPQCKLERLRLDFCGISDKGCDFLALALRSNPLHLKQLDLSGNQFNYTGLKNLFAEFQNPNCKLEKLCMRLCGLTDKACAALASVLRSNPSQLRELDLSKNKFGDFGMKLLAGGLESPYCRLKVLRLRDCDITHEGCAVLASALRSNPSHLRELDFSGNKLRSTGVRRLSGELANFDSNLEILRLDNCEVSNEGCADLAEALKSNPSNLKELDLCWNKLGDTGVQQLFTALENPNCKLEVLRLRDCNIADDGCAALASILKSNPSHLRDLDLSQNDVRSSGVKLLSGALKRPECKLEILRLEYCNIKDDGCASLASALRSNPSHLRELYLYMNNLHFPGAGRQLLSNIQDNPNYKLQTLHYESHNLLLNT